MAFGFDVHVADARRADLTDGVAVDQDLDGDQHALGEDRVIGRKAEVALRDAGCECVGPYPDGPDRFWVRVAATVHAAMADPCDTACCPCDGEYFIARAEALRGDVAVWRADTGACGEAGDIRDLGAAAAVGEDGKVVEK